jgi:cytochrome c1
MFLLIACNELDKKPLTPKTHEPGDLNAFITELPDAPGYETFKTNCTSCHSARYIQMQPELPEKTWSAIVAKMQKSFGAPVADSSAKQIVQYLVSIKGKK